MENKDMENDKEVRRLSIEAIAEVSFIDDDYDETHRSTAFRNIESALIAYGDMREKQALESRKVPSVEELAILIFDLQKFRYEDSQEEAQELAKAIHQRLIKA